MLSWCQAQSLVPGRYRESRRTPSLVVACRLPITFFLSVRAMSGMYYVGLTYRASATSTRQRKWRLSQTFDSDVLLSYEHGARESKLRLVSLIQYVGRCSFIGDEETPLECVVEKETFTKTLCCREVSRLGTVFVWFWGLVQEVP